VLTPFMAHLQCPLFFDCALTISFLANGIMKK
jgi:hypothetical protein